MAGGPPVFGWWALQSAFRGSPVTSVKVVPVTVGSPRVPAGAATAAVVTVVAPAYGGTEAADGVNGRALSDT